MSRTEEKLTIYDVNQIATENGEWVNGSFQGVVENPTQGQGRKPSKCTLRDPDTNATVKLAVFGGTDLMRMRGALVECSGDGMKAKLYKGEVEVTIGDKAHINVISAPPRNAPAPQQSAPASNPAPRNAPPAHPATAAEIAKNFHITMRKIGLLLMHSQQYAFDFAKKWEDTSGGHKLTDEQFQSVRTSFFMTAKDRGLLDIQPGPRAFDSAAGVFTPYTAPAAPSKTPEQLEAEKKELERKAAEEAELKRQREKLDEDVPY